jgi:hypothetical protein
MSSENMNVPLAGCRNTMLDWGSMTRPTTNLIKANDTELTSRGIFKN